ncbi:MAG: cytochrome C oxidase subunit IV family protein [Actinomycetota bacterium]|nr:cytochrome C oxidase subunit IV family protein [Actinomycetota bacterium]
MEQTHKHPSDIQYMKIAAILAVVTAAEVAVYYVKAMRPIIVPVLLSMALVKFILVASWFMHLRFDSKVFKRLFVLGIVLAIIVFGIVLVTFTIVQRPGSPIG